MKKTLIEKEAIIAEYLSGNTTYRKLGSKYGIDFRILHSWVMKYQGKQSRVAKKSKAEPDSASSGSSNVNGIQD